jgi:hypothetical protein
MDLRVSQQWLATVRANHADSRKDVGLRFLSTQARDYLASVVWFPTLWTSEIVVQAAKHRFTPVTELLRRPFLCPTRTLKLWPKMERLIRASLIPLLDGMLKTPPLPKAEEVVEVAKPPWTSAITLKLG